MKCIIDPARHLPRRQASALLLTLALTACGGGGGSSSNDETDPDAGGGQPPTLSIDSYIGTWRGACKPSPEVTRDGLPVNVVVELTTTKLTATSGNVSHTEYYYGPGDSSCTGASIGFNRRAKDSNRLELEALRSASFNSTVVEAGAVHLVIAAAGGLSAGGNVVINGITFPGNYFQRAIDRKDLVYIGADGKLYLGDTANVAADSYPATLDASAPYMRQ